MARQQYPVTSEHVRILGRTIRIEDTLWLGWSASGIEFTTDAAEVTIDILAITPTGAPADYAYLGLILDGDEEHMQRIRVDRGQHTYTLLSNFALRAHEVRLIKISEARNDKVGLVSLTADSPLVPTKAPDRRILFIGDSITAGYGIDCDDPEHYDGLTTAAENVTRAYAYRTAQALGADCQIIAWSGNGIVSQYIDPGTDIPYTEDLIPTLYPYTDRATEQIVKIYLSAHGKPQNLNDLTVYDPHAFVPDTVVTFLGTNDATFTKSYLPRERYFTERYVQLLKALGADYPEARRVVLYGTLEQTLSDACAHAASIAGADYLALPAMDPATEGMGAVGHPSAVTQQRIADILVQNIQVADALR